MDKLGDQLPILWDNDMFIIGYLSKLIKPCYGQPDNKMIESNYEILLNFIFNHQKSNIKPYIKAIIFINYLQFKKKRVCNLSLQLL